MATIEQIERVVDDLLYNEVGFFRRELELALGHWIEWINPEESPCYFNYCMVTPHGAFILNLDCDDGEIQLVINGYVRSRSVTYH